MPMNRYRLSGCERIAVYAKGIHLDVKRLFRQANCSECSIEYIGDFALVDSRLL
jgi:hypothetical protein